MKDLEEVQCCDMDDKHMICVDILDDKNAGLDGDSSEIPITLPKIESINKSNEEPSDEAVKCSKQNNKAMKLNEPIELRDMQEHPSQSLSGKESDESEDVMEHDVKVCDICGDAGWADQLAICSRCSDGAEHTYCMRKMLDKVPESRWLCEECMFLDETEKQMQAKAEMVDRNGKIHSTECLSSVNGDYFVNMDIKDSDVDVNIVRNSDREVDRTNRGNRSSKIIGKRHSDNSETAPFEKRQDLGTSSHPGVLNLGKIKPTHQISSLACSFDHVLEPPSSPSIRRFQTLRGTLLKSNSFNTSTLQPKVKPLDEAIPQKQKGDREPCKILDIKGGPSRLMGKSMSFTSGLGRPNAAEGKAKMISHNQEQKELKQAKERNNFEKKNSFRFDSPVISPSTSGSAAPEANLKTRDLKVRSEGGLRGLSKPNSYKTRKGVDVSVGASTNGMCSTIVQKHSQGSIKEEPSSSSSLTPERVDSLQDGVPLLREATNQSDKTRDDLYRSRQNDTTGEKNDFCQNGKEIGQASSVNASCTKNAKEQLDNGSRLKAALEAAMLKRPGIYRKNKVSKPSEKLSVSTKELKFEKAFQDQLSVPCHLQHMVYDGETKDKKTFSEAGLSCKDAGKSVSDVNIEVFVPLKTYAIPEHEYIWQGGFEVHIPGKLQDLCGGLQAHLSTCASPKVCEVVRKFPEKVSLNEVPRSSTWPTHFHDNGANDDNIALYFFAKDLESYERNYKCLVDRMINNDLALKGNFDGAELLIFPSNQLPERSQRWNMLFFLWGVFRGKRKSCLDDILGSLKKLPISGLSTTHKNNYRHITSVPESISKHSHLDMNSSANERSCSVSLECNPLAEMTPRVILPSETIYPHFDTKVPSIEKTQINLLANSGKLDHILESVSTTLSGNVLSCPEMRCTTNSPIKETNSGYRSDIDHQASPLTGVGPIANVEKTIISESEVKFESNLNEQELIEAKSSVETKEFGDLKLNHRRCMTAIFPELNTQSSSGTSQVKWNSKNDTLVDEGHISKKQKICLHKIPRSNSSSNTSSLDDRFASCLGVTDNSENSFSSERRFFPIDLGKVGDFQSQGKSIAVEDQHVDVSPNLELALGVEKKLSKQEIFPFFVGTKGADKCVDMTRVKGEGQQDASASLSLSLSLPFPDKDKPALNLGKLMSERKHINTSLFFSRLS